MRIALLTAMLAVASAPAHATETRQVRDFGPNPGNLLMFEYVPADLPDGAPLVVALHGCTQSADEFGEASGWTELADRLSFALLLPEQQERNNTDLCFNFFLTEDNRRNQGEAASIMAMIKALQARHDTDPDRVFITGLSAGGAMTAVMLAAYPDVFRGGAIIAGVPYGCASTAGHWLLDIQRQWFLLTNPFGEAGWAAYLCGIDRTGWLPMQPRPRDAQEWHDLVRNAAGPATSIWPRISIWHGSDDRTVHPLNLSELVKQWTAVHGIDQIPDREEHTSAYRRREYRDAQGNTKVEAIEVLGMGHALPVDPGPAPAQCGRIVPPHFVDEDVCAALDIASFWGVAGAGR